MKAFFVVAIFAFGLLGCATYTTYHPPGRYEADYDSCLVDHMTFPDATPDSSATAPQKTATSQLASLVDALVSGKALTRDVYKKSAENKEIAPSPAAEDLRYTESAPFQQFMDCYLGPVDPIDFDTRLLRGHSALAILAEYSAQQITDAPPAKRKDYAKTALSGITDAELALKSGSYTEANQLWGKKQAAGAATNPTSATVGLYTSLVSVNANGQSLNAHSVANVARVKAILELGALADSVATRNFIAALTDLITNAISNSSPTGIAEDVAQRGLKALTTTASINAFGAAYFQESAILLYPITQCRPNDFARPSGMCESTTTPVDIKGAAVSELLGLTADGAKVDCTKDAANRLCLRHAAWQRWNTTIEDACTKLSSLVGSANTNNCLPTTDQLQKVSVWIPQGSDQATQPAETAQPTPITTKSKKPTKPVN